MDFNNILLDIQTRRTWSGQELDYLTFHQRRYELLLNKLTIINTDDPIRRALDVGPSFQTLMIKALFPQTTLDTLGFMFEPFDFHASSTSTRPSRHYTLDLNECYYREKWPKDLPPGSSYDVITCCEVIEHLPTPPEATFSFFRELLRPGGYLIIQTPNAAFIGSRIKLLFGRNPYMRIRAERNNPGHFREYTLLELKDIAHASGFEVESIRGVNYFTHSGIKRTLLALSSLLSGTFKNGFTMVCRLPHN